jgi:hypothetical protein
VPDSRGLQPQATAIVSSDLITVTGGNIADDDICFRSKQIKRDLIREFLSNSGEQCLNPTAYSIRGQILVLKKDAVTPSCIVIPNYFFHLQVLKDEKSLRFKTSSSSLHTKYLQIYMDLKRKYSASEIIGVAV